MIPYKEKLVIKIDEAPEQKGGILLAETAVEKPQTGTIVAVWKDESEFEVGQRILFEKWGAQEIEQDGQKLSVISKTDILAIGFR
jgi:chaperonin GroES